MRSRSSETGIDPIGSTVLVVVALLAMHAAATPAIAAEDGDAIIRRMKAALEPAKPSTRLMTMTTEKEGEKSQLSLIQARKNFPDGARSLTFAVAPDDVRGIAYLVEERQSKPENVEYMYLPYVRRVRELVPAENYTSFLQTDFTYGDLGFLPMDAKNKLIGTEDFLGKKAYKIESIPGSTAKQWYYARYVTWIDTESTLPIQREFFSPANMRFKVETFADVVVIDGVPTPTRILIRDLAQSSSTELKVQSVSYNNAIPDDFFTPGKLPELSKEGNAAEKAARGAAKQP